MALGQTVKFNLNFKTDMCGIWKAFLVFGIVDLMVGGWGG